jgi:hypothetical protein
MELLLVGLNPGALLTFTDHNPVLLCRRGNSALLYGLRHGLRRGGGRSGLRRRVVQRNSRSIKRDLSQPRRDIPDQLSIEGLAGYDDQVASTDRKKADYAQIAASRTVADNLAKWLAFARKLWELVVLLVEKSGIRKTRICGGRHSKAAAASSRARHSTLPASPGWVALFRSPASDSARGSVSHALRAVPPVHC